MSDTTTEVVYLLLKSGLDISAGEKKIQWEDGLSTIMKQPGAKRVLWGRQIEDPDTVQMIIGMCIVMVVHEKDWDSLESHQAFTQSPSYKPFIEKISEHFLAGPPNYFHVKFPAAQIAKGDPFTAPVSECFSAFFEPDYDTSKYDTQFFGFQEVMGQIENVGSEGIAGGWSIEKQGHEALGEGVQGQLFVLFRGWESLAAHTKFVESEHIHKVVPYLYEGPVAKNVRHIEFKEYKK
ncbi:hypothetical protein yc1106_00713 [Curvularia clavata]|uniref:ABM domain-containing protein n=1 Tax=Curvularia clavata TaxID=95742 RepID=A0A9Q8Z0C5_CURCL|nr:hypothetical protein yc1106_00713 [Curvularia clavata]